MNAAMTSLQPTGAVFHRCALQVSPHRDGDTPSHAAAIVAKAVEFGVSGLAAAGSGSVSGVPRRGRGSGRHPFPWL